MIIDSFRKILFNRNISDYTQVIEKISIQQKFLRRYVGHWKNFHSIEISLTKRSSLEKFLFTRKMPDDTYVVGIISIKQENVLRFKEY